MIAKLICYFKGHLRGKKLSAENGIAVYECPRCRARWTRKVKA